MPRRLLLLSNSKNHGSQYLEHCKQAVIEFFQRNSVTKILFVPYAMNDHEKYANKVRIAFKDFNIGIESLHEAEDAVDRINNASGIYIGGGNTFLLLKTLYDKHLIEPIRKRVLEDGIPYMGASAGTNVATVSICTTNDMPIVHPPSLAALNLIPFNINPHYLDPDLQSTHMGETRAERIAQYHEIVNIPVLGLREGSWLEIEDDSVVLRGRSTARLFVCGNNPEEVEAGSTLNSLLSV